MGNSHLQPKGIKLKEVSRVIKVKSSINNRLSAEERQQLIENFDHLQDNRLINKWIFRMHVIGAQVPEVISERLFSIFSSQISPFASLQQRTIQNLNGLQNPDAMAFEDFLAFYTVMRHGKDEELGQIVFESLKLSKEQEFVTRDDLIHFCRRVAQLNENFVNLFYKKTKLDP